MVASSQLTWPRETSVGPQGALHQWRSANPQGFLGRYQLDSTYQPQYGRVVVTVASELALSLEAKTNSIEQY